MTLSEKEATDLFEKMMEDMNLSKAPLRDKDLSTKREMADKYLSAPAKSGGLKNSKHECTLSSARVHSWTAIWNSWRKAS